MQFKIDHGAGNSPDYFPIVLVGASAGGLLPFEDFLKTLPEKFDFAIVFMQHLSPKHKNLLPELLRSRMRGLHIEEASEGLTILPGMVYLCPPASEVRIEKDIFRVTSRSRPHTHLPIDELLVSLSEDSPDRTIAVILSGAGTDGARGVQAVKTGGGTVFVQDPMTAEFPDMPLAAIGTGHVDTVAQPQEIAREILRFQRTGTAAVQEDHFMTPLLFDSLCKMMIDMTGNHFNHYKLTVVSRRVRRRMYLHGVATVAEYLNLLAASDGEAEQLASDLLIGVTAFFRDRLAWKALHLEVTRKLVAEENTTPIRVWAAACATGEEAYSIAMMLQHELDLAGSKRDIQVFATDVNDRALERAREGIYPASISADLPPGYLRTYFTSSENDLSVTINKEIRQQVIFAKQDLLTDPPFSRLDLIICRNLLIYLEPEAQERCISLFHYALKAPGYLFLGNAESPGRTSSLFTALAHKKCRIYKKTDAKGTARIPLSLPIVTERSKEKAKPALEQRQSITHFIQEALLEEHAPAAVAINQSHEIIYHNGPTNRYLSQPRGTPTQNLLELLPEKLRNRLRGGLYRAAQEAKPVTIRTSITTDERKKQVFIRISKLQENLFLITFTEKGGVHAEAESLQDTTALEETAVFQLERELAGTRDELQSHIEELKSVNEELESSNEELQAANEELETSREELQSLNEELTTVNSQLQTKIEEQEETNNDLNNFLTSTNIPTFFLDQNLRVKRFTPAMSRLITLIPADVGRPIMDMSRESLGPDLITDVQSVLGNLTPLKREVAIDGAWYERTTLPYRTMDNRIEGVVITYMDISERKNAEERISHMASFPELNPNPVLEVDASGAIIFCNPATSAILAKLGMDDGACQVFVPPDLPNLLRDWDGQAELVFTREVIINDRAFDETIQLIPRFKVARIYGRDITVRKKMEENLAESERRLAVIVDSIADGFFAIDRQWYITHVNDAALGHFGRTREDVVGRQFFEVFPFSRGTSFETEYGRAMKTGEPVHFEVPSLVSHKTMEVHAYPGPENVTVLFRDVTERIRMQDALKESEERVRLKLEAVLSPEGDISSLELGDIIDITAIQSLMADFNALTHITVAVLDLQGKVLIGEGWQDICTKFHRAHADACKHCIESDTELTRGVSPGESKLYKCKNNMWDIATPIMVGGQHLGNFFSGQFFFEDEPIDYEVFRSQARQYGFDEEQYLETLEAVPRLSKDTVERAMAFLIKLTQALSQLSYSNIKLARSLAQGEALMESLQESETRLRRAQELSHLGSWELDLVENRLAWSDEVFRIFGLEPQEFGATYEAFLDVVHPDDRTAVDKAYSSSLRDGQDTYEIDHRIVRKTTGEVRVVHEKCEHFRNESGRIIRSVGMILDVTDRKQAEEILKKVHEDLEKRVQERTTELQQAYDKLIQESKERQQLEAQLRQVQKMEALGTLTGGIAHDFNNILAAIIGFTEIVRDHTAKDGRDKHHLERIMEAGLRGRELIKRMLAFSRKTEQEKKPVFLSGIVTETMNFVRSSTPTTINIRLDVKSESGMVFADPVQIQQVILNLCTNAVQAMKRSSGILRVEVSDWMVDESNGDTGGMKPGPYIRLMVNDTGTGIPADIIDRVFDPFFTTKGVGEGTGLGLSVVHGIVLQHEGYIFVQSREGEGSTFMVYLPMVAEEVPVRSLNEPLASMGTERVLFIDDEELLAEMGGEMLEDLGYKVTVTTSSSEALSLVKTDPYQFDLVITDVTMPEITGVELAQGILDLRADMPIIMCTGFSHLVDGDAVKASGVKAFAMKPLTKREIAKTIRTVLDGQKSPSLGQ
jgi:two-component system, chemotaxis family, CheB/CheR fusion protein